MAIKRFYVLFLFFFSCFICLSFLQNPFLFSYGYDCSVYKYIGRMIVEGQIPYRDIFDHKGPFLYLWYALGEIIHPRFGQYLLSVFWLFLFFLIVFYVAQRLVSPFKSMLVICLLFSIFFDADTLGNAEGLAMLPFGVCVYFFEKFIYENEINKTNSVLFGMACSLLALVKPTYLLVPAMLGGYVFINSLYHRRYVFVRDFLLYAGGGFFIPTSMVILWLYVQGAIGDFYNDYILFNIEYAGKFHELESLGHTAFLFIKRMESRILAVAVCLLILFNKRLKENERKGVLLYFLLYVGLFLLIIIHKNPYGHYAFVLLVPIFMLVVYAVKVFPFNKILMAFLVVGILFNFYNYEKLVLRELKAVATRVLPTKMAAHYIEKHFDENVKIASLSDDFCASYLYSHRVSQTKYPFLRVIYKIRRDEIVSEFSKNPPQVVFAPANGNPYEDLVNLDDYKVVYDNYQTRVMVKK